MDLMSFGAGIVVGLAIAGALLMTISLCFAAKRGDRQAAQIEHRLANERGEHYHGHNR